MASLSFPYLSNEVKYVIIAVIAVAIIWFGLRLYLHVDNPFYVVSSESMVPALMVGDVVVLRNGLAGGGFSFSDLHIGDIIVFHTRDGGGRTIVHRGMQIYHDGNSISGSNSSSSGSGNEGTEGQQIIVRTKGDHNPLSYNGLDYPIREADYYGKVIFTIPKVGLIFRALSTPILSYVILLAVSIILVATAVLHYNKKKPIKRAGK
jgi:signal peptidase I